MLTQIVNEIASGVIVYTLGAAVCVVAEMAFQAERQTIASRLRGLCFSFLSISASVLAVLLFREMARATGFRPVLAIDLTTTPQSSNPVLAVLGYTVFPFLSLIVYDFWYYVFHRLQHTVPLLWRFHAVHHSIEELNAFNAYHHVLEYFFRIPIIMIPLVGLIWIDAPKITVVVAATEFLSILAHANTRIGLGIFRYVLTEPRQHRVHHSIERRHWDRNFAFTFPVFDVIFGTAYFPKEGEFPKTGLDYVREPKELRAYIFPPAPPKSARKPLWPGKRPRRVVRPG